MASRGHFWCPKITSYHYRSIHFFFHSLHFLPFQINTFLIYLFHKMAAVCHFWCTEIASDRTFQINMQYTFFVYFFSQNGRQRPFWMPDGCVKYEFDGHWYHSYVKHKLWRAAVAAEMDNGDKITLPCTGKPNVWNTNTRA